MIWHKLNDKAWYAEYAGWHVTKNYQHTDAYNKDQYEYVATKDGKCERSCSWDFVRQRILKTTQIKLL